jgi:NAF domain
MQPFRPNELKCTHVCQDNHVKEKKDEQPAAMNAFELIALSKGLNLENLFDIEKVRISNCEYLIVFNFPIFKSFPHPDYEYLIVLNFPIFFFVSSEVQERDKIYFKVFCKGNCEKDRRSRKASWF